MFFVKKKEFFYYAGFFREIKAEKIEEDFVKFWIGKNTF